MEADSVSLLQSIFDSVGYYTWRESGYPNNTRKKLDLWAESPLPAGHGGDCLIEVKNVWDTIDLRLNDKRMQEKGEFLKDFQLLSEIPDSDHQKIVVWIVYSRSPSIAEPSQVGSTHRLASLMQVIESEFDATVVGRDSLDVSTLTKDFAAFGNHVHIVVWTVPSRA